MRRTTPTLVSGSMVAWGTISCDFWNGGAAMSTSYGPLVREKNGSFSCAPSGILKYLAEESCSAEVVVVPKFDMQCYESKMTAKDVKLLARKYNVPLDLHPCAPPKGWTMDQLPPEVIGLYEQFFKFSGLRVPFSTLLLSTIRHFRVHISQLVPLGLNRLIMFEIYCRSLGISPTVSLFCVFYKISKQGHWFSFEKRVGKNAGGKIFNETFSGMKGWKDRFLFLDRRVVLDVMAWRHHNSDVYDAFPDNDFSIQYVMTLTERVIDLRPVPPDLIFGAGLATTWDFPGFFPVFKDTGGNVVTMSEYLRFPFLSGTSIGKGDALPPNNLVGQHTTPPLLADQPISDKTDSQLEVEVENLKVIVAREKKRAQAARQLPKRKKTRGQMMKEEIALCDTGHDDGEPNAPGNENRLASHYPHGSVSEPKTNADGSSHPLNCEVENLSTGAPASQPKQILTGRNIEEGESSRGASMYVPQWVIPLRCRVDTPEWCRELMVHLAPPAAQEESNALTNEVALQRA
ncbi:hypothetical protein Tco_0587009 [Tanacetum coccineum]